MILENRSSDVKNSDRTTTKTAGCVKQITKCVAQELFLKNTNQKSKISSQNRKLVDWLASFSPFETIFWLENSGNLGKNVRKQKENLELFLKKVTMTKLMESKSVNYTLECLKLSIFRPGANVTKEPKTSTEKKIFSYPNVAITR